jgi:hypothetical protein
MYAFLLVIIFSGLYIDNVEMDRSAVSAVNELISKDTNTVCPGDVYRMYLVQRAVSSILTDFRFMLYVD